MLVQRCVGVAPKDYIVVFAAALQLAAEIITFRKNKSGMDWKHGKIKNLFSCCWRLQKKHLHELSLPFSHYVFTPVS